LTGRRPWTYDTAAFDRSWFRVAMRPTIDPDCPCAPIRPAAPSARPAPAVHLIGIAGSGMRSLAQWFVQAGWRVTGSDRHADRLPATPPFDQVAVGQHSAGHVPPHAELVVYSAAVGEDNCELRRARRLRLPVLTYFEAVGRIMAGRQGLAVAGTHGKSTTTAMAAHLLIQGGCDPTVLLGATPIGWPTGGRFGRSDLVLAEACEYRGNFLHLAPQVAAIHRVEPDHFDCFATQRQLEEAFGRFITRLPRSGVVLVRQECPVLQRLGPLAQAKLETFGVNAGADWAADKVTLTAGSSRFRLLRQGRPLGWFHLPLPGAHNVVNALAAVAIGWHSGLGPEEMAGALASFPGVRRRLQAVGQWHGAIVLEDYAHHPTEVACAMEALRVMFAGRRLWCVFQPHQVSRTARLLEPLASSLAGADHVLVLPIYRAREPEATAREARKLQAALARLVEREGRSAVLTPSLHGAIASLQARVRQGDVVVVMGAGDVWKVASWLPKAHCHPV